MDLDIIVEIASQKMNPESTKKIIELEQRFARFNYVDHEYELETIYANSERIDDLALEMSNLYTTHMKALLYALGVVVINDITFTDVYPVFMAITDIEYIDNSKAKEFLGYLETEDETHIAISKIIESLTDISYTTCYGYIEDLFPKLKDNLTLVLEKLSEEKDELEEEDLEDDMYTELVIKKVLFALDRQLNAPDKHLWIFSLIQEGVKTDISINSIIQATWPEDSYMLISDHELAINILAILVLGVESRFDRINYFNLYFEDQIEVNAKLVSVYNIVKKYERFVEDNFKKHDVLNKLTHIEEPADDLTRLYSNPA